MACVVFVKRGQASMLDCWARSGTEDQAAGEEPVEIMGPAKQELGVAAVDQEMSIMNKLEDR